MPLHSRPPAAVCSSKVVSFTRYRREKWRRSSQTLQLQRPHVFRPLPNPQVFLDADYRGRMKVNAVILLFLIFLIASGIWLLDGLSDAFGPERLARQHSQSDWISSVRLSRLASEIREHF